LVGRIVSVLFTFDNGQVPMMDGVLADIWRSSALRNDYVSEFGFVVDIGYDPSAAWALTERASDSFSIFD
jgi:hypothetical protein